MREWIRSLTFPVMEGEGVRVELLSFEELLLAFEVRETLLNELPVLL